MPRPKKAEIYEEERKGVLKRLYEILGLDEKKKEFIVYELEKDIKKQEAILGLKEECKKYFNCSQWPFFRKRVANREYLALMRSILKACNKEYIISNKTIKIDDKSINTLIYHIL